uniref:Uncharacterized protein n=1 Tax=Hyoscyamus niger TaxID=4079 RepID=A0A059Q6K4_HYONI|nr:hypothetical protein [Hyoscyamus niger]AGU46481.1 hypothetical protein [Hyoscyamus niger]
MIKWFYFSFQKLHFSHFSDHVFEKLTSLIYSDHLFFFYDSIYRYFQSWKKEGITQFFGCYNILDIVQILSILI